MSADSMKRSIVRNGQKTSVSLESEFWDGLREIASQQRITLSTLVSQIAQTRTGNNLSSAIRVFVLNHLRAQIAAVRQPTEADEAR
jgi:predicted DNA-binding ribbon-helix-helix protein